MSRLTALLLAGIISCQAFYNAGVLTYWLANRAYISSSLCENRSRPAMHCDGKCYLQKKLAPETNPLSSDAQRFPALQKGLDLGECPSRMTLPLFAFVGVASHSVLVNDDGHCATGFPNAIFHPPSCQA